jgi:hypothetical protein
MKKLLFIALLCCSTAAMAADGNTPAAAPATDAKVATAPATAGDSDKKVMKEEKFEDRKAKVLEHISKHIAEAQKRQACVEAATNHDALKACMPERKGHGGWHGKNEGGEEGKKD